MTREEFTHRLVRAHSDRARIRILIDAMEDLMGTVDDIHAALTQLVSDTSTALANIATKISALEGQVNDPAVVQDILADINALDTTVKAADPGAPAAP